jgi:hypothetical protein
MRSLVKLIPSKQDYPRLGVWTFCIAWLIGNIALIIGFNGGQGKVPAIFAFVIACITWWGGFWLGGTKGRVGTSVGFLALSIWILNFLGAMALYFHYYVTDLFFWASASALLLLITAIALTKAPDSTERP